MAPINAPTMAMAGNSNSGVMYPAAASATAELIMAPITA
ncbi:Uncharacterised protein [Mycobacterium tuberculosis]|nr:Uncharacterised protein [Mycobacterium tuberculosis]